jgi:hypothetical protein
MYFDQGPASGTGSPVFRIGRLEGMPGMLWKYILISLGLIIVNHIDTLTF